MFSFSFPFIEESNTKKTYKRKIKKIQIKNKQNEDCKLEDDNLLKAPFNEIETISIFEENIENDLKKIKTEQDETEVLKKKKKEVQKKSSDNKLRHINKKHNSIKENFSVLQISETLHLKYLNTENLLSNQDLSPLLSITSKSHSDLIPNVYEGGLKVWECSVDLLSYLSLYDFSGLKVLDLGCGHGLLGMRALLGGASEVHFHDYNDLVIQHVTCTNVSHLLSQIINKKKQNKRKNTSNKNPKVRYFSGHWDLFVDNLTFKYDLILSSETIYQPQSFPSLRRIICHFLHPKGFCFFAAKSYYFGVGGGTKDFENFLKSKGGLIIEWPKQIKSQGVGRDILRINLE